MISQSLVKGLDLFTISEKKNKKNVKIKVTLELS